MLKDIGLNEAIMAPELTKGVGMLMYGKEVSNRKQEIDRQYHTIPNQRSQRPKDKHRPMWEKEGNHIPLLFRALHTTGNRGTIRALSEYGVASHTQCLTNAI